MRLRRNIELKSSELEQALERLKKQDVQLAALEEEILYANNRILNISSTFTPDSKIPVKIQKLNMKNVATDTSTIETKIKIINKEVQTISVPTVNNKNEEIISMLKDDIKKQEKQIILKDTNLQEQSRRICDLEKDIENLRIQLREKENQQLQQISNEPVNERLSLNSNERQQINIIDDIDLEEYNSLKVFTFYFSICHKCTIHINTDTFKV